MTSREAGAEAGCFEVGVFPLTCPAKMSGEAEIEEAGCAEGHLGLKE